MKSNNTYCYSAIMSALLKFYSIHDIAREIEENSMDEIGNELAVYSCRSDGFILRKKKDTIVSDADIVKVIVKVLKKLIKDEDDAVESYVSEQYDVDMKSSMVCSEMVEKIFDIEKNGRMITIEMDI